MKRFLIILCCVLFSVSQCKKEPAEPSEEEKAKIFEEQEKKKKEISEALKKHNEPISYDNIDDVISGIKVFNLDAKKDLESIPNFDYFCEDHGSESTLYLYTFGDDATIKYQMDYMDNLIEATWTTDSKTKVTTTMDYPYTIELTEKPQVLKFTSKAENGKEPAVNYLFFCYDVKHRYAQEVVIPKLGL